jgi:DNA-binding NtrC family response regulator
VYVVREDSDSAPTLMKGVSGFLTWPLQYRQLLGVIRNAEQEGRRGVLFGKTPSVSLTGNSPQLKEVQALIRHVAMTDANVLLLGESGTGKEVVARAIHHLSLRTDQPFVAVNCGAIPPERSAMKKAPSPAPSARVKAASNSPKAARSSSTKSATCRCPCR